MIVELDRIEAHTNTPILQFVGNSLIIIMIKIITISGCEGWRIVAFLWLTAWKFIFYTSCSLADCWIFEKMALPVLWKIRTIWPQCSTAGGTGDRDHKTPVRVSLLAPSSNDSSLPLLFWSSESSSRLSSDPMMSTSSAKITKHKILSSVLLVAKIPART